MLLQQSKMRNIRYINCILALATTFAMCSSQTLLCFQVRLLISDVARHKLLVLAGQCFENTGELILQSGSFSFFNFIDIFTDQEVSFYNRDTFLLSDWPIVVLFV